MDDEGDGIAAVIVEPVAGNMGCVLPVDGFLETLRRETEKHGTVLILMKSCAVSAQNSMAHRESTVLFPI